MLSAAAVFGFATVGYAADSASPFDSLAADYSTYKAKAKAPAKVDDDSLCYKGICVYGALDLGLTYQSHGAPANQFGGVQWNYLPVNNDRGSQFGVGSNQLSGSFIGIRGKQEVADNLYAIFLLKTNFNPNYGIDSSGFASIAQNNGLPTLQQNAFGDSSRNGQLFNDQAWVGLTNPTWGTVTIGRQYSLTNDGVINYDPLGSSGAFSAIGFFGATAGVGDTERRIWDNAIKYSVGVGPVRFAAVVEPRAGTNSGSQGNAYQGSVGFDYAGFSFDVIGAHEDDAISANTLSSAQLQAISGARAATPAALGFTNAALTGAFDAASIVQGLGQGPGLVQGNVSDNTGVMVLGKYSIGQWKFYGGYENFRQVNPNNPLNAGSFLPGGFVLGAVNNNAFATARISQTSWIGTKYAVNSNLDLTLAYYHLTTNSWAGTSRGNSGSLVSNNNSGALIGAGCSDASNAQCSGQQDVVSFVADWRFAKRFDLYGGVVWTQNANGFASGFTGIRGAQAGYSNFSVWAPSAGIKFTF
jgi:predicted porin